MGVFGFGQNSNGRFLSDNDATAHGERYGKNGRELIVDLLGKNGPLLDGAERDKAEMDEETPEVFAHSSYDERRDDPTLAEMFSSGDSFPFGDSKVSITGRLYFRDQLSTWINSHGEFASFTLIVARYRRTGEIRAHFLYAKVLDEQIVKALKTLPKYAPIEVTGYLESFDGKMYINVRKLGVVAPPIRNFRGEEE